jgi:hypothetical protein
VILGGNHVTKYGDRDRYPDMTTMVEARHPGSLYVVLLHDMEGTPEEAAKNGGNTGGGCEVLAAGADPNRGHAAGRRCIR